MSFTISKRQLLVVSDCFIQTAELTEGRARPAPAYQPPISHPTYPQQLCTTHASKHFIKIDFSTPAKQYSVV